MLKKSMYLAIVSLLFLSFSVILQLIDKKSTEDLLLGFVAIGLIIAGIICNYNDNIDQALVFFIFAGVGILPIALFSFYYNLSLNNLYDNSILISWILSNITLLVAGLSSGGRIRFKSKRKKDICPKCGAKLSPGYNICSQCGENLEKKSKN